MKRKRRIDTREVYRWKARLNVHGGKQQHGVNYWDTYAPVVTWSSIRLLLVLATMHSWETKQIDFVLAYPQADIECDMYMEIPKGFEIDGNRKDYVLQLKKNLYGQKQAGRVWNQHLDKQLKAMQFKQSDHDECVYFHCDAMFVVYINGTIIAARTKATISKIMHEIQKTMNISDEGTLSDYLGVKVCLLYTSPSPRDGATSRMPSSA